MRTLHSIPQRRPWHPPGQRLQRRPMAIHHSLRWGGVQQLISPKYGVNRGFHQPKCGGLCNIIWFYMV